METSAYHRVKPLTGDRRRCVRHRIHTPAYASLTEESESLELCEILDISEEGIAIQTSTQPELNQTIDLCLDLTEANSRVRTPGYVVRLDGAGRAAIRFPDISEAARRQLKEWLFLNALMAEVNRLSADSEFKYRVDETQNKTTEYTEENTQSDFTSLLAALAAVDREVMSMESNLTAALQLIVDRAVTFTSASGSAIALSQGSEMVCASTSGSHVPPLESRLQAGSGFSGECIRTGRLMRCDDSEQDSRVDLESCRLLGIRSMMAEPIYRHGSVIGLLEVFSSKPNGLRSDAETVLRHLAETATAAIRNSELKDGPTPAEPPEYEEAVKEHASWIPSYKLMLIGTALVILMAVLMFRVGPWRKASPLPAHPSADSVSTQAAVTKPLPLATRVGEFQSLMLRAQQGDPSAEFAIGARYAIGQGVKQDYGEAIRWFTMAAEQGHIISQATLGAYYWAGRGVPPDLEKAYYWSILAQNGGDQASKYRVAVLASRMTSSQVNTAQLRANDWIKQHRGIIQTATRERVPQ